MKIVKATTQQAWPNEPDSSDVHCEQRCTRCGEWLDGHNMVWIGFEGERSLAAARAEVTDWHPFGSGCARAVARGASPWEAK